MKAGGKLSVFLVAVLLAIGSFAYGRCRYVNSHTLGISLGGGSAAVSYADRKLFGNWVKDELVFAVIVPVALIAGGAVLALRK